MKEFDIVKAKTKEDCKICSEFMSQLIDFEAGFDSTINSNVIVSELFEKNIDNKGLPW